IKRMCPGASADEVAAAARLLVLAPLRNRQADRIACADRDAWLYRSRAAPVLSAHTPLTPMTNVQSDGSFTPRSKRTGQKLYSMRHPGRAQTIAVWSSLPPKVPTPRSPSRDPKLWPFSMQPRYPARSYGLRMFARYASCCAI